MQTMYKMQTADCKMQTEKKVIVPRLICEKISSKNILSVTQLLFCGYLLRKLGFLWTIPFSCPHIYVLNKVAHPQVIYPLLT